MHSQHGHVYGIDGHPFPGGRQRRRVSAQVNRCFVCLQSFKAICIRGFAKAAQTRNARTVKKTTKKNLQHTRMSSEAGWENLSAQPCSMFTRSFTKWKVCLQLFFCALFGCPTIRNASHPIPLLRQLILQNLSRDWGKPAAEKMCRLYTHTHTQRKQNKQKAKTTRKTKMAKKHKKPLPKNIYSTKRTTARTQKACSVCSFPTVRVLRPRLRHDSGRVASWGVHINECPTIIITCRENLFANRCHFRFWTGMTDAMSMPERAIPGLGGSMGFPSLSSHDVRVHGQDSESRNSRRRG